MESYKICVELYKYGTTTISIGTEKDLERAKAAARSLADLCGDLTASEILRIYVERGIDERIFEIPLAAER